MSAAVVIAVSGAAAAAAASSASAASAASHGASGPMPPWAEFLILGLAASVVAVMVYVIVDMIRMVAFDR